MIEWASWLEKSAWMADAACKNAETDIFFEEERLEEAKAICKGCPAFDACLKYGCSYSMLRDETGVYGGMLPRQRRTHVRTQRKRIRGK